MAGGSTSGLFFPVLSADGLHKAQTAINPYFGDGCEPETQHPKGCVPPGLPLYSDAVRSPAPGWAPPQLLVVCDVWGRSAPHAAPGAAGLRWAGGAPPLLGGLWVSCHPAVVFLPLSRRIPILRDQMIPAVLLHYLKVVVFSFFFPSLTFCVCVCVCIPVSHERLFGSGVRSRLQITRRAARQRHGGQRGVSELAGKPWLGCLLGSAEADEPLEMDRACPAH